MSNGMFNINDLISYIYIYITWFEKALPHLWSAAYVSHRLSPKWTTLPFLLLSLPQILNLFPSMLFLLLKRDRSRMERDLQNTKDTQKYQCIKIASQTRTGALSRSFLPTSSPHLDASFSLVFLINALILRYSFTHENTLGLEQKVEVYWDRFCTNFLCLNLLFFSDHSVGDHPNV